jgi:hypothetical protein
MASKADNRRKDIAAWTAIGLGIVLGILLKRVRYGFLLGLLLGALIVYLYTRKRR